jgi:opacity protein-like surface antigen
MTTYKVKKLAAGIVLACSATACAADSVYNFREQGGYSVEERSYGTSYGGTTWQREEYPYYPTYKQNQNSSPDNRTVDRNRNGVPDQREQDRNRNGIADSKEYNRNIDGKPTRIDPNLNWNNSNHQSQTDNKSRDGYKQPDYNNGSPNHKYGNGTYYGR